MMEIKKISIKSFKTLNDVEFEPGRVNVFVGANGAGKTTILEAIGLLSAALSDRIDNNSMQRKGIRLSVPKLYKSNFADIKKAKFISFALQCIQQENRFDYHVNLNIPNESELAKRDTWRYHSERFAQNDEQLAGRSGASRAEFDSCIGLYLQEPDLAKSMAVDIVEALKDYAIYQPNTQTLRGTQIDLYQNSPLGLCGGRLAEAIDELLHTNEDGDTLLGDMLLDDVLELIEWASEIKIAAPKKSNINSSVPTTRQLIEFQDRFMSAGLPFTAYDASEGGLYVLFLLCLALHNNTPRIFAVDSFDHAMHPRLAQATTRVFCDSVLRNGKTAFVTTHNPLVLDGLNLSDDRIRLFAVNKSRKNGHTTLQRIQVTEEMISRGASLSRLWIEGRLGGVPNLL